MKCTSIFNSMCIYLCQEYEGILLILCAPCVMVNHMLRCKTDMMRLVVSMRACFSIRGEYVTHMKFRENQGNHLELAN